MTTGPVSGRPFGRPVSLSGYPCFRRSWLFADVVIVLTGDIWSVVFFGVQYAGRIRFRRLNGEPAVGSRDSRGVVFGYFSSVGAVLEFVRLLRPGLSGGADEWEEPSVSAFEGNADLGFFVPGCPEFGSADPSDMAVLARRVFFEIEAGFVPFGRELVGKSLGLAAVNADPMMSADYLASFQGWVVEIERVMLGALVDNPLSFIRSPLDLAPVEPKPTGGSLIAYMASLGVFGIETPFCESIVSSGFFASIVSRMSVEGVSMLAVEVGQSESVGSVTGTSSAAFQYRRYRTIASIDPAFVCSPEFSEFMQKVSTTPP